MDYLSHSPSFWFKEDGKKICERIKNWLVKTSSRRTNRTKPYGSEWLKGGNKKDLLKEVESVDFHLDSISIVLAVKRLLIRSWLRLIKGQRRRGRRGRVRLSRVAAHCRCFRWKQALIIPDFDKTREVLRSNIKNRKRKSRKQSNTVIGWKQRNANAWTVAEKWRNEKWTERLIWRKEEKVWLMEGALK